MSTQSYYKDRLGFDPREALYDGAPPSSQSSTTIKSGSRSRSVQHHYTTSTTTSSSHQAANGNNNNNHYDYHNNSPSKKIKHSAAYTSNTMVSGVGASSGSAINISGSNNNSQADGYEDALTQFKGTMSVWDYFVENWDITGMNNHTHTPYARPNPTQFSPHTRSNTFRLRHRFRLQRAIEFCWWRIRWHADLAVWFFSFIAYWFDFDFLFLILFDSKILIQGFIPRSSSGTNL